MEEDQVEEDPLTLLHRQKMEEDQSEEDQSEEDPVTFLHRKMMEVHPPILIHDHDGSYCGYVQLDSSSYEINKPGGTKLHEFIAISEGNTPMRVLIHDASSERFFPDVKYLAEGLCCTEDYCYYNVLLIERDEKDIAYRAGLGRILKSA